MPKKIGRTATAFLRRCRLAWADFWPQAKRARAGDGVSVRRQIWELLRLRFGTGKLSIQDYYTLGVYRPELPMDQKRKFVSTEAIFKTWPRINWTIVSLDKLLAYTVLAQQGFKTPEIHAIVHVGRQYKETRSLRNVKEVMAYCCDGMTVPCVAKPIAGGSSRGVYVIKAVDQDAETIGFKDGSVQSLKQFADELISTESGYMFQELLRPHVAIAEMCGDNLCTVCMMSIFEGASVHVHGSYWKIAVEPNMADNYWRKGNLLALVDLADGTVKHCSTGQGVDYRRVGIHPVTQKAIGGFQLPDWNEAVAAVLNASRAFPGIVIQSWDVALTDNGPVLLEVNVGGIHLPQVAEQRGLYGGAFRAVLERNSH